MGLGWSLTSVDWAQSRLLQRRLVCLLEVLPDRINVGRGLKLDDVSDLIATFDDLDEARITDSAFEVDGGAHTVRQYVQVGKDAGTAEEHITVPSDDLDLAKRLHELLDGGVGADDRLGAVAEDVSPVACPAGMALIHLREGSAALGTHPSGGGLLLGSIGGCIRH